MSKNKRVSEWSHRKKFNPFNSNKLIAHTDRWRLIKKGEPIPQPVLVTVDPINRCNFRCKWCNADYVLNKNNQMLSKDTLLDIGDFLSEWKNGISEKGVRAVCIAGGGEPLLNPHTAEFIDRCSELGIQTGVVTNGTLIDKFLEPLSKCSWVGVSMDAGSPETLKKIKGVDMFDKIINNIKLLVDYSKENNTLLSGPEQSKGVSYKYLLDPSNIHEIYKSARLAKEIGCRNFHMRPVGIPWDKLTGNDSSPFGKESIQEFREQVEKARELEDENFGVFGVTHKFDDKFGVFNNFETCYAIFMTGVFMPPSDDKGKLNFGLCCDRRGDDNLTIKNITDLSTITKFWGSNKHWEMFDKIMVSKCPRCTYRPHNEIYHHVVLKDNMSYDFI